MRRAFGLLLAGVAACGPARLPVAVESPAAPGSLAPDWAQVEGPPALSWWEPVGASGPPWRLRFARWGPGGWSPAVTIAQGGDYFANWADRPGVAAGADGGLYAHWLEKIGGDPYAYGIPVARSTDGGASWLPLGLLHHDGAAAEHGFVTLLPEGRGVRAFWLDGRETVNGGAMTLRSALLDEAVRGETEVLVDGRICDCCSTAAVTTPAGPLVAYRDRDPEEVRDIALVRRTAAGWTAPAPLHRDGWTIAGCPVNGPALAGQGETVWAAWFTAEGDHPRVLGAVSRDGGASFGPPIAIDSAAPLGRLDFAALPAGGAVLSWLGSQGESGVLRLVVLDAEGRLGVIREVARTATSRGSGVPRIRVFDGEIWVTWVTPGDAEKGVRSRVEVRRVPV